MMTGEWQHSRTNRKFAERRRSFQRMQYGRQLLDAVSRDWESGEANRRRVKQSGVDDEEFMKILGLGVSQEARNKKSYKTLQSVTNSVRNSDNSKNVKAYDDRTFLLAHIRGKSKSQE